MCAAGLTVRAAYVTIMQQKCMVKWYNQSDAQFCCHRPDVCCSMLHALHFKWMSFAC